MTENEFDTILFFEEDCEAEIHQLTKEDLDICLNDINKLGYTLAHYIEDDIRKSKKVIGIMKLSNDYAMNFLILEKNKTWNNKTNKRSW